ncbi:GH32 C-terminal domain-containing protein [Halalkalibacter sp. AB-rgal2]|uniref:glycoside hydrolase family 32 protein n=1 Tax=Halalkalibacter sp. AB-rgal2 TaxID=3242695 RepID=UPI00359CFBFE
MRRNNGYLRVVIVIFVFTLFVSGTVIISAEGDVFMSNIGGNNSSMIESNDYYTELYRPQFHFSTPAGRLADPNGLIYFESEYHLFHQKMGTWAHAVSQDLIHWEHLPIALEHDELGQALSGSAVVDWNDTSGFFDGEAGMVAIYTSTHGGEAQSIAYSKDNGRTWERYGGNPVIENPGIKDFRDPKVFWHDETEKWVMVVSTDKSVAFYNSSNLIEWEYQSKFGDDQGSQVAVWECPDLFRLPVDGDKHNQKWVLHVSIGDNHVTDGSTAQYFVGEFDGYEFTNINPADEVLFTDFGQDFYAAQSFNDISSDDGRRIWLGWMANWRYPYQSPTFPWMGSMSIPRELSLRTVDDSIRLFQEPIREIESLRATKYTIDSFILEGEHTIKDFSGSTYEFEMVIAYDDVDEFGIRLRQSEENETVAGVDVNSEKVFLDRSNAGLETLVDRNGDTFQFGKRFETDYPTDKKQIKLRGLVDESSVELFIDDGEYVFTNLIYTKPTNRGIELYSHGGKVEILSLDFYHLDSIWRVSPADGEIERIVVSEEEVVLEVGELTELIAHAKPDWLNVLSPFEWEVAKAGLIELKAIDETIVSITGIEMGTTSVTISDPNSGIFKDITVRVVEDRTSKYTDGWGPSPLTGRVSGNWDIFDQTSLSSHIEFNPEWKEIFREEVLTTDFSVSTDIQWIDQGDEGFPKYGVTIQDEEGTMVSAFFNVDINQLETFARNHHQDFGWEGVDLPAGTDLQEASTLKVEKEGDIFTFYINGEQMYERIVEMKGDMSVGLINENTKAEFRNFEVEKLSDPIFDHEIDVTDLEKLINSAKGITNKGVTEASYQRLQEAIKRAIEDLETITTDEELLIAIERLQESINDLQIKELSPVPIKKEIDVRDLEELIERAIKLTNKSMTEESYQVLQVAINSAMEKLDNINSDDELNKTISELQAAISEVEFSLHETKSQEGDDEVLFDSDKLPNTSTVLFNLLLLGIVLVTIGGTVMYRYRNRENES